MSLAILYSRAQVALSAPLVTVEVLLSKGMPGFSIVGMPETAVRESRDRVRAALINCQFQFPKRRITVNLAPADLPKEGGRFDLPIALGILAASGQIPDDRLGDHEFVGELALNGGLRRVDGALPTAIHSARAGRKLVVPASNAGEAALVSELTVLGAQHLLDVCSHLRSEQPLEPCTSAPQPRTDTAVLDLEDVKGQHQARRALEVAASGGHNLLFMGPPGTGKTMLASRLPGLLPPMTDGEAVESAAVRSVARCFDETQWRQRPFRAPHHTSSAVALVGGSSQPRPGEVSLAHHGILFLDELPEFDRRVLEVLREPLESGAVTISRAARQAEFPARFQLVAAMNPCPCGYLGDEGGRCTCTPDQIMRYRNRISGPLLDRIDMHVEVPRVSPASLRRSGETPENSAAVRQRVLTARRIQEERAGKLNARLAGRELHQYCGLQEKDQDLLDTAAERLGLSARAYDRILRVARTVADLAGAEFIGRSHLLEAIGYRRLDRNGTE